MNKLKIVVISLACVFFFIVGPINAATVLYEISGEVTGSFRPVSGDPFADLLNVNRATANILPFKLQMVVDTSIAPYIENDNSFVQQVTYRKAIVSEILNLNGTEFRTLRSPLKHTADVPPPNMNIPNDEANIEILNFVGSTAGDNFTINMGQFQPEASPLFNNYTVPINQTINGTLYENAIVDLWRFGLSIYGMFDGIGLPSENGFSGTIPAGSSIYFDLGADWGEPVPESLRLVGTGVSSFNISTVPVPGAVWLLGSGIFWLIGFRRKLKI